MGNILLRGYFGHGNWGDEILLRALVRGFGKNGFPKERFHYWRGRDRSFQPAAIGHSIPRGIKGIAAWASASAMVFCGGIFYDHLPDFKIRRLQHIFLMVRISRLLGKKIVMLGVSIGPLVTPEGRRLTRKILELAHIIRVRDRLSHDFCRKAGLNCRQMPDLSAILLPDIPLADKALGNGEILFIPCASGMGYQTHVKILNALTAVARRYRFRIRLMPIHMNVDTELAHRLADQMGFQMAPALSADPMDLFNRLKDAELIVSARLHGGWAAYLLGRPLLQIDHHTKCRGFAETIGLPGKCLIDPFVETVDLEAGARLWFEAGDDLSGDFTSRRALEKQAMLALADVAQNLRAGQKPMDTR